MQTVQLSTGGEARLSDLCHDQAVICVNGGSGKEKPGDWSATLEWLVQRLTKSRRSMGFVEVRYRVKSWRRLDLCIADATAALDLARSRGASRFAFLGFSMGGAVSIGVAGAENVPTVIGLAPWIPDRLDVSGMTGKRLAAVHGGLDRPLPGVPGVSPNHARRGLERLRNVGAEVSQTVIPGAVHGVALRAPGGALVPLPRARRWLEFVDVELDRFATTDAREGA